MVAIGFFLGRSDLIELPQSVETALTEPKEGNIFENLLTGERIEIDQIGLGSELVAHYERFNTSLEQLDLGQELMLQMMVVPSLNASDSTERCFSYKKKDDGGCAWGRVG